MITYKTVLNRLRAYDGATSLASHAGCLSPSERDKARADAKKARMELIKAIRVYAKKESK